MVCMAESWITATGSESNLSQNGRNSSETDIEHLAYRSRNSANVIIKEDKDQVNSDSDKYIRPRSFSDASLSSRKRRQPGINQTNLDKKKAVKVIICRESKVVKEPDRGRTGNQDKNTESDKARPLLSRSKSAHGRTNFSSLSEEDDDRPPPKPKLPESYRPYYFLQQVEKLKPATSQSSIQQGFHEDESHYFRSAVPYTEKQFDETETSIKKLHSSEVPKDRKQRTVNESDTKGTTTSVVKESGPKKNEVDSSKSGDPSGKGKKVFRSDSRIASYRSFDAQLRADALRKELDTLRSSEHVRQRLSSSEQNDVLQPKIDLTNLRKPAIDRHSLKLGANDNAHNIPGLKSSAYHESSKEKHGAQAPIKEDKTDTKGSFRRAFLPSRAHKETTSGKTSDTPNQRWENLVKMIDEKRKQDKEQLTSSTLQRRDSRSKSESSLIRKTLDSSAVPKSSRTDLVSNQTKDKQSNPRVSKLSKSVSHLITKKDDNILAIKPALHIKRKKDTIRKFNYDLIAQAREKVKLNYQRKPERNDSDSPLYIDTPERDNDAVDSILHTRMREVGDNRSDEEKYAALSRSKILHSKSSSLDSHLDATRKVDKNKSSAHPIAKPTSSSSLTDYRTRPIERSTDNISSSTDSLEVYLSENKGVKHETFNTDIPTLPKKELKAGKAKIASKDENLTGKAETSTQQKIVLRQCRIGSDVAFGLVGLHKTKPEPNGNGFLDGQGLVTLRMIPDEQGRFGFNVKGGADQGMPIIVSRVAPNTPADNCIPRLNEGDQVLFINGRDVSQHTHEQVVMFIRASRETHSGELILKIRPNVYSGEENMDEPDLVYDPDTHQISSAATGANALDVSLKVLEESLDSGAALAQFEQLYRKKPGMTMNAARLENNIPKNRYRDISPYDQTRVMIKSGSSGDYINANYVNMEIPVSGIVNRYIAAQGPLPATCTDFWQMVWEQQSTLVVMLTTKVERGRIKCHQYWPDNYETSDFGTLQITCVKEEETTSFAFREFNLTNVETNEERHISHMQYIAWPDHGVPDDPVDFLEFVVKVRQKRVGIVEPVIVHCSAGIGRTGVLITMETAMCLIEANQPVYPLSIVRQMRDQRAMLIQTPSQYKFVCEAVIRSYNEGIAKALPEYQR